MSDPYFSRVQEYWDTIRRAYIDFAQKKPIILVDVDEAKVYAYPYHDFKADLSPRSQASLEQQYTAAIKDSKILVFVRDNRKRKLVSYTVSPEEG